MKLTRLSGNRFYILISCVLLAIAVADYFQLFFFAPERPADFLGQSIHFSGVVAAEPEAREFNTRLLVKVSRGGRKLEQETRALLEQRRAVD
jgi:hypothetical protein